LETDYLRIHRTDFHDFSPHDSYLYVDDRPGPLSDFSRDIVMATNFRAKFGYVGSFDTAAFQDGLQYCHSDSKMFNDNILSTTYAYLIKIGPVTQEIKRV